MQYDAPILFAPEKNTAGIFCIEEFARQANKLRHRENMRSHSAWVTLHFSILVLH
jgi:hypothetical protein